MTRFKKFAWRGGAIGIAGLVAIAMIASVSAIDTLTLDPDTVQSTGTPAQTDSDAVAVASQNLAAGDFITFRIDPASTGGARILEAGGNQQFFSCAFGDPCQSDVDEATVTLRGTAAGQVLVNATYFFNGVEQDTVQAVLTVEGPTEVANLAMWFDPPTGPALPSGAPISLSRPAFGFNTTALVVELTNAAGSPITGEVIDVFVSAPVGPTQVDIDGGSSSACVTGGNGRCDVTVTTRATSALGQHRLTAVSTFQNFTAANSIDLFVAGPTAVVTIDAPETMDTATSAPITISGEDEDGNPSWTDSLTLQASGDGGFGTTCTRFSVGETSCLYLSPGLAQTVIIAAQVGAVVEEAHIQVGDPAPPPGEGGFTGDIAPSGVSQVTYNGGSTTEFAADVQAAGAVSAWVTSAGAFVGLVTGAPAFANAQFMNLFPTEVPAGTIVILVLP